MAREIPIIWLDSVDSTNTEVYRRADRLDNMSVIAARDQTAGRGQRGNSWLVDPGTNLTFSMYLRFGEGFLPPLPADDQFALSEAATLAVARLMESEGIEAYDYIVVNDNLDVCVEELHQLVNAARRAPVRREAFIKEIREELKGFAKGAE